MKRKTIPISDCRHLIQRHRHLQRRLSWTLLVLQTLAGGRPLNIDHNNFKMKNTPSKLIDDITDNLMSQVKNIQLHMVYLHNNMDVKGIPRYEIKLNNIKLSVLDEKYINGRFKNLKHSKDETQRTTTNKAIKL